MAAGRGDWTRLRVRFFLTLFCTPHSDSGADEQVPTFHPNMATRWACSKENFLSEFQSPPITVSSCTESSVTGLTGVGDPTVAERRV